VLLYDEKAQEFCERCQKIMCSQNFWKWSRKVTDEDMTEQMNILNNKNKTRGILNPE